ncbi:transketolase [Xylona heveae TC161]|uniref:Transketolase n=1 Tax=Xylona heveae (strain CBS 132557 / TC161) TaxID=1328760 RepID=A0A165K388_XYLHT|nr:transketolase [Xylona heveae TC161]KZF26935.1 transketolase [Xylona heveae TC161]
MASLTINPATFNTQVAFRRSLEKGALILYDEVESNPESPTNISGSESDSQNQTTETDHGDHDLILKATSVLIADLCQQFDGGHPGGAIGMVAIGIALWRYAMCYSPEDPTWFNRDRFVLSNGHCCLLQYIFMHYAGYRDMTMDQLKSYHSDRLDSLCPGHPEIQNPGIEVSTGPLGQGIANATGLAMAAKHLGSIFNRPGYPIVDNTTWCLTGDACLQEGPALEAISLAGQWGLDNLILIYDNNQIQSDGPVRLTNSEDINLKMKACGWNVINVDNGSRDVNGILSAIHSAKVRNGKPTFINVKTVIGIYTKNSNTRKAHGTPLGEEETFHLKSRLGFDTNLSFDVPKDVADFFASIPIQGAEHVRKWQDLLGEYERHYPDLGTRFRERMNGKAPEVINTVSPFDLSLNVSGWSNSPLSTRDGSAYVIQPYLKRHDCFMVGTADLDSSVGLAWEGKEDFQSPNLSVAKEFRGSYTGRYIHFGTREHAMAAISNGIAAYHPGTIIPITSTFLMFTLYAAPAIRMAALQDLQVIHIATHDSVSIGEDGPTHQPVEVAALYRAMPNLLFIRPADVEELEGAWQAAIASTKMPTMISLSSEPTEQFPGMTNRQSVLKGAYTIIQNERADVTLIGVGSELEFAVQTHKCLASKGIAARVVSFPCQRLFEQQSREYRRETLQRNKGIPAVVIEAFVSNGWERYADAAVCMKSFGKSLPPRQAQAYFGFQKENIVKVVMAFLEDWHNGQVQGEFQELAQIRI